MKSFLFFVVLFFSLFRIHGQSFCETEFTTNNKLYFDKLIKDSGIDFSKSPEDTLDIPIAFYIETYSGTPVYDADNLDAVMNQMNVFYAPGKIRFFRCGPAYYFENGTSVEPIKHVIRVYIKTSYDGCGVFVFDSNIWINPDCGRPFDEILAHEVGHELGLPHTHGFTNLPLIPELVDGSNCTFAGDWFCDTPADPNIFYDVTLSCVYVGTRTDANGDFYHPDTHNIMSYTNSGCMDRLSEEQFIKAHNVAESMNYKCCFTPEPEVNDVSICTGSSATFNATITSGEIRWYDAPDGNLIATGTSFTTPVLNSSKSYFVHGFEGCGSDFVKVTANVLPQGGILGNIPQRMTHFGGDTSSSIIDINNIINTDSLLYIKINFKELWSFNGEPGGEQLVFTAGSSGDGGNTSRLTSVAAGPNKLLLGVNNQNTGPSLWVTDGTPGNSELLMEWSNSDYSNSDFLITELNGSFIFILTRLPDKNAEIWISDGTAAGTQMVFDTETVSSLLKQFYKYNNKLYFSGFNELSDREIWVTDGTASGTYQLKDINLNGSSYPDKFTEHNGMLYFTAVDEINGNQLWKTDGSEENTTRVSNFTQEDITYFSELKSIDNYLYFTADNRSIGYEPYLTDGTTSGTVLIEDINVLGDSKAHSFTKCNGSVYFLATGISDVVDDLYKYQPATQLLTLVKRFSVPGVSGRSEMVCYNNQLYFNSRSEYYNYNPWVSDGTESGTEMWLDLNPWDLFPTDKFIVFNDQLLFTQQDSSGVQLYRSSEKSYNACHGDVVEIQTQNQNGTVSWYDAPADGNLLGTGYSFITDALSDSISFWAELTVEGCSSDRTEITVAVTTIDVEASITHATNPSDGSIDLTVSGGVAPYSFDWDPDGTGDFDDEEDLTGLIPGNYEVTVVDAGGCMTSASFEVFSVPQLVLDSVIEIDCFGNSNGAIQISVEGGTEPFVYSWNTGADTEDLSGLSSGEYTLTLIDANGLSETMTVIIEEPVELSATANQTQFITCFGEANGSFEISTLGGTAPYQYAIEGGAFVTDSIFANLGAGTYHIEIVDAHGCSLPDSIQLTEPAALDFNNISVVHNLCSGQSQGTIDFEVIGGTAPYSYQLDGISVTLPVTGLSTGSYTLVIDDANGCATATTVVIEEPEEILGTADQTGFVSCFGLADAAVEITVQGGTAPYNYAYNGGVFTSDSVFNNLDAGSYNYEIMDANGCLFSDGFEIAQPDELTALENEIQFISCFGENDAIVEVNAQGGTAPYEYSVFGQAFDANNIFPDIGAGTFTYSVMDFNGCLFTGDFVVTEPEVLDYSLEIVNVIGNDPGSIDLTVFGGTPPYTYDWDNDGTGDYDDTEDLENLEAGTYTVNVLDFNNCTFSASAEVEFIVGINEAGVLSAIHIYPNPTENVLIIEFGDLTDMQPDIRLYNELGQVIYQKDKVSDNLLEIDLSTRESGIYLLKIYAEGDLLIERILKQ